MSVTCALSASAPLSAEFSPGIPPWGSGERSRSAVIVQLATTPATMPKAKLDKTAKRMGYKGGPS